MNNNAMRFGSICVVACRDLAQVGNRRDYWNVPATKFTVYVNSSVADAQERHETIARRDELVRRQNTLKGKGKDLDTHDQYALDNYERRLKVTGPGTIYMNGRIVNPHDERIADIARKLSPFETRDEHGKSLPSESDGSQPYNPHKLRGYGPVDKMVEATNLNTVLADVFRNTDLTKSEPNLGWTDSMGNEFRKLQAMFVRTAEQGQVKQSFSTHNGGENQRNYLTVDYTDPVGVV